MTKTITAVLEILPVDSAEASRTLAAQDTGFFRSFDWAADRERYAPLDVAFQNTTSAPADTVAQVIALADKECTVDADQITVYRDEAAGIWKVEYHIVHGYQGYQLVYLDDQGITQRIAQTPSKDAGAEFYAPVE